MDQNLVDKVGELLGKSQDEVKDLLNDLSLDQSYDLIDAMMKGQDDKIKELMAPIVAAKDEQPDQSQEQPETDDSQTDSETDNSALDVEEAVKDKWKKPIKVPAQKPFDPMAKEVNTNPLYRPKTTPNRKDIVAKKENKHKGRRFDESLKESAMNSQDFKSMQRMMELAGFNVTENELVDLMGGDFDFSDYGIPTTPVGTVLTPGAVEIEPETTTDPLAQVWDNPEDAAYDDHDADDAEQVVPMAAPVVTQNADHMQKVRDAGGVIMAAIPELKVTEYAEVKEMINQLQSLIDQLANCMKGD